jgi:hypothetical protein
MAPFGLVSADFGTLVIPSQTLSKATLDMSLDFPIVWRPSEEICDRYLPRKVFSHENVS